MGTELTEIKEIIEKEILLKNAKNLLTTGTETLASGTNVQLSFKVTKGYKAFITKIEVSNIPNTSYLIKVNTLTSRINELIPYIAEPVDEDSPIIIDISNAGTSTEIYDYVIQGYEIPKK